MVCRTVYGCNWDKTDMQVSCNVPVNKSIEARRIAISYVLGLDYKKGIVKSCDDLEVLDSAISDFISGKNIINVGESGTAMRFMAGIISLKTDRLIILTGEGRQNSRPIKPLVDSLRSIGCNIQYLGNEGFPPIGINKRDETKIDFIEIDCSQSSQYLSSLLIACIFLGEGASIQIKSSLVSKSYVDMTIGCLELFGVKYAVEGNRYTLRKIEKKSNTIDPEFDFSSISFIYEIVSLMPYGFKVLINNVKKSDMQGDCYYSEKAFQMLGVKTSYGEYGMVLSNDGLEKRDFIQMDMQSCPDLVLSFVASMLGNNIPFELSNISHLRFKESDRIEAIKQESKKLGYNLMVTDNSISYDGNQIAVACTDISISSHKDHRIAMAFAPLLSVKHNGGIVCDSSVVSKSFPYFWDEIDKLGIKTKEEKR